MLAGKPRKVLVRIGIALLDLLDDILTDISIVLLDLFGAVGSSRRRSCTTLSAESLLEIGGKLKRARALTPSTDPRAG